MAYFLVPRARSGRVPTNEGVFSTLALIPVSRGVCTPKKWMSIFTFIDGFPPSQLIVFCRSPPGMCAVSTKKTRWLVSLWGTGFPCSRDKIPSLATVILPFFLPWLSSTNYYVPLIEHSDFILGILTLPSALSRLFWQPTLGVFSQFIWLCIQLQCRSQVCILRSVHRQNKCLKLQRSLRG